MSVAVGSLDGRITLVRIEVTRRRRSGVLSSYGNQVSNNNNNVDAAIDRGQLSAPA